MHGHGNVAEQGFGARGGDFQVAVLAFDGIEDVPHEAVFFLADDFQVRHRRAQHRVPVDQPLAAVDQAFPVQFDEDFADRPGQALVHGEAFAAPVRRGAQPPHLAGDGRAGVLLPFPHLFQEFLAAEVMALDALGVELALDHDLRGDAGVVGARLPQGVVTLHAVQADERIHQGVLEGVAQCAACR